MPGTSVAVEGTMGAAQQTLSALLRSRFLSAYYVANVLVLASYVVLRPLVDLAADTTTRHQLKTFVRPQRRAPGSDTRHSTHPRLPCAQERQGLAVLAFNFILKVCVEGLTCVRRSKVPVPHRDDSPTPPAADHEVPLG